MNISVNHNEWMLEQKYRPSTVEECILPAVDKEVFRGIVKSGRCPHLVLVSRSPGTGKTTIGRAIVHDLDAELLFVNGADCKIDFIRNEMTRFASARTMKPGGKIILIDEFDRKGLADAQRHMRSFMEAYSNNCSIIITANNADGIIEPLKSRSRVIEFGNPTDADKVSMMKQMIVRCNEILKLENIPCEDMKVVAALVKKNFPDFRRTITELDRYAQKGVIDSGILAQSDQASDIQQLVEALKTKDFRTVRGLVSRYTNDYPTFISKLYETLYAQAAPQSIPGIILTIGDNQKYYQQVANLEIHISMMLVQLMMETNWK
ncbi:MAG: AAA family ATPase [Cetobacterium sp.]|uniref:AAA family ATPase n=1 Tax=Cetobacterium sp. TaxID=2071632 RepID=UPI003EE616AD